MKFSRKLFLSNLVLIVVPVITVALAGTLQSIAYIEDLVASNARMELERLEERCAKEHQVLLNLGISDMDFYLDNTKRKILDWVTENPIVGASVFIRDSQGYLIPPPARINSKTVVKTTFEPWGWTLGIAGSSSFIEDYSTRTGFTTLLGLILGIVPALVMAILLGRSLVRPMMVLREAALAMGGGNLDARAAVRTRDEIGELASTFNAMAANLSVLTRQLEDTVQKRTAELADSQEALEEARKELLQKERFTGIGTLVAGVAHEINTPLGLCVTISSWMENQAKFLKEKYDGNSLTRQDFEDFLNAVGQNAGNMGLHLSRASELMGTFKQLAVDQTSERKRLINLGAYLQTILASLEHKLKGAGVQVHREIAKDIDLETCPAWFYQILTNLINNAMLHGFGGKGGEIRINLLREPGAIVLVHEDNGKGMSKDVQEHIFNAFYSTRHNEGGSGLGLNIVQTIVQDKLEGTIHCVSEPGRGARFTITIPLK